jgi:hypothetical protein
MSKAKTHQTGQKLEKRIQENQKNIGRLLRDTKRQGINYLLGWMESTDYFTAPASTRLDYHGCEPGGLAEHSMNVYLSMLHKKELYKFDLRDDELTIASLCHDFCKIGLYVPNILKSGRLSDTKPYMVEDTFPFGHGEKSVLMVSRHIELTTKEAMLIRWHMGKFDAEWENYENKVAAACPEIYAFQAADHEASNYMDYRKK